LAGQFLVTKFYAYPEATPQTDVHQCECRRQFFRIQRLAPRAPAVGGGRSQAITGPLSDQASFEMRDRAKDVKDQLAADEVSIFSSIETSPMPRALS
jgi:hypothetical protein